jgi:hypothetical protein
MAQVAYYLLALQALGPMFNASTIKKKKNQNGFLASGKTDFIITS